MATNLYFAYGSNLNIPDWHRWCREKGFSEGLLTPVSTAVLIGYRLSFSHRSQARQGGALTILPSIGHGVEGVLFEVRNAGWQALDLKEGRPLVYEKTSMAVVGNDGKPVRAWTYILNPARLHDFVEPATGYAELVDEALKQFGLSTKYLEAAASDREMPRLTNYLFSTRFG